MRYCASFGCRSCNNDKNRRFFSFPRDESRCIQWIKKINRPELFEKPIENLFKTYSLCDLHFDGSQFLKKKILNTAVPTLNLPHQQISYCTQTQATQTYTLTFDCGSQTSISYHPKFDLTPTKHKLAASSLRKKKIQGSSELQCKRRKILEQRETATASQIEIEIEPVYTSSLSIQTCLEPYSHENVTDTSDCDENTMSAIKKENETDASDCEEYKEFSIKKENETETSVNRKDEMFEIKKENETDASDPTISIKT